MFISIFLHIFAPRLDEKGQCAIGTLTTLDNKNAMAYADICVEKGWLGNVGCPFIFTCNGHLFRKKRVPSAERLNKTYATCQKLGNTIGYVSAVTTKEAQSTILGGK